MVSERQTRERWLAQTYRDKGLVLILGAGVSVRSAFPRGTICSAWRP